MIKLEYENVFERMIADLTRLARLKAKGARFVDMRKVRLVIPPCNGGETHIHDRGGNRGMICLQAGILLAPKGPQEWLIGSLVSYLHTKRRRRAKQLLAVQARVIGPEHNRLEKEYWNWRRTHAAEIRGFTRSYNARMRAPIYEQHRPRQLSVP
jgi:hypothetical protein